MKRITLLIIVFEFLAPEQLLCQEELHTREITFVNNTTTNRYFHVKVYPASMVFQGRPNVQTPGKYDLTARTYEQFRYISGSNYGNYPQTFFTISPRNLIGFNFDNEGSSSSNVGALGIGIYKMEFWWDNDPYEEEPDDTCYIEFDPAHCFILGYPVTCDINIEFHDNNNNPRIEFAFNNCPYANISAVGRWIKSWIQCEGHSRPKSTDLLVYDNTVPCYFDNKFPFDPRIDCSVHPIPNCSTYIGYQLHEFGSSLSGVLINRLSIQKNLSTRADFYDTLLYRYLAKDIVILPEAELEIYNNITLTLSQYSNWTNAVKMYVKGNMIRYPYQNGLVLQNNSQLLVKSRSSLILERYSRVWLNYSNSYIIVERGGVICNYGAIVKGPGRIIISAPSSMCPFPDGPIEQVYTNDAQLILQDSASLELPANYTMTFDSGAVLIAKPNTTIKLGENSKIIFKNGARVFADSCTFTSLDANSTWAGIFSYDLSQDTVRNCIIENAYDGVNIINKNSGSLTPCSVEISSCTFRNTTTTQLKNAVHITNSNNCLVRNNTISSAQLENGFRYGIYADYCLAGNVNIIENTIENCETGLSVVSCSPYIARNTITGSSGSAYGMFLDNANGIVKYNLVQNFNYSLYLLYSSPFLLCNTLRDASQINLELLSNSIPVMKPINSGSQIRLLGGGNIIPGNPSSAGINLDFDSYPLMDSGYNRIENGSGAYVNGSIPGSIPGGQLQRNSELVGKPESRPGKISGGRRGNNL